MSEARGLVYGSSYDHVVRALNASTGAVVWTADVGESVSNPAALGPDGTVFIASTSDLWAFDGATGAQKWRVALRNASPSAVSADGVIYVAFDNVAVAAFDGATGAPLWNHSAPGAVRNGVGPVLGADGTLFVPLNQRHLVLALGG